MLFTRIWNAEPGVFFKGIQLNWKCEVLDIIALNKTGKKTLPLQNFQSNDRDINKSDKQMKYSIYDKGLEAVELEEMEKWSTKLIKMVRKVVTVKVSSENPSKHKEGPAKQLSGGKALQTYWKEVQYPWGICLVCSWAKEKAYVDVVAYARERAEGNKVCKINLSQLCNIF